MRSHRQPVHFTYSDMSENQQFATKSRLTFYTNSSSRYESSPKIHYFQPRYINDSSTKNTQLEHKDRKREIPLMKIQSKFQQRKLHHEKNSLLKQSLDSIPTPHKKDVERGKSNAENAKQQIIKKEEIRSLTYNNIKPTFGIQKYFMLCGMDRGNSKNGCQCSHPCKWATHWTSSYRSQNKKLYDKLLCEKEEILSTQQIDKDLHRTYPKCPTFSTNSQFTERLRNILVAYSIYDREVGYVQGMNMVAAVLLYHIKEEDKTFWGLVELMDEIELRMIYLQGFQMLYKHIEVIKSMIERKLPDIWSFLKQMDLPADIFLHGWLFSLMSNCIPLEYMHLVVEQFKNRGWFFIYQLIITFLTYSKEAILVADDSSELLSILKNQNAQQLGLKWQQMISNCYKVGN